MVGRIRLPRFSPSALVFLLGLSALVAGLVAAPHAAGQTGGRLVRVVPLSGAITPPMAEFVTAAIEEAEREGAAAVVIELDTPGGLMTATDEIIRAILASEVPVVVWVGPEGARAASAGVFVTYAGHVAAMAPSTRIGSASPVALGGEMDETMRRKVTNDAVSQIRTLADLRGRNADWAEEAVRDAANVTADEARRLDVVDLLAPDLPTLLAEIDGRTVTTATGPVTIDTAAAETARVEMGWLDQLLTLLADPTIAYILLSLGGLGIVLELSNPGITFPGVFGGIALLLGLYGLGTLPVNWTGVALIGLAFVLFVVDIFVTSLGTLTVGGLVAFVLGSYLLFGGGTPGLTVAPTAIWTIAVLLALTFALLALLAGRSLRRRPATGREGLVGAVGTVRRALAPDGVVFVEGELWQATAATDGGAEAAPVPVGAAIAVAAVDGLRLIVRPASKAEKADAGVAILPPSEARPDRARDPSPTAPSPADAT